MLTDLLATDGVVEHCELRSTVGFLAIHGGMEAGTWEIAAEAASRSGASLYAVVQPDDLTWHVPSVRFDPADSDRLAAFCAHVGPVISLHGYGGLRESANRWLTVLVGGGGRPEAGLVARELRRRLPEYDVVDDMEVIPRQYRGVHPANPVNRTREGGVQIELPPRIRGRSPVWADHDFEAEPWTPHTTSLLDGLVAAAEALGQP